MVTFDLLGATDRTTRRPMPDTANNFEQPPVFTGHQLYIFVDFIGEILHTICFLFLSSPGDQQSDSKSSGDPIPKQPVTNGPMLSHGTPAGSIHPMPTMGIHRLPLISVPHGMQYRHPFNHLHAHDGLQFFPHAPSIGLRSDRYNLLCFLFLWPILEKCNLDLHHHISYLTILSHHGIS